MESLTDNRLKNRFLKAKADEIRSLKRKFENELNEIEEINSYYAAIENGKEIIPIVKLKNAKELVSRTNELLEKNDIELLSSDNMEIDLSINQFTGEELRRERAGELFQYGFEVKYLPLARYLQTASKYISTENWSAAREEFRLARVFDRYLELRNGKASLLLQLQQQPYPARCKTRHDAFLEEISWMSNDFRCETAWKQKIARQIALEARDYVLRKKCYWPTSKLSTIFNYSPNDKAESFYLVDLDNAGLISRIPSPAASDDIPVERDELKTLCRLGDHLDNSTTGDLIVTAEYQLGTSAAFPSINWYEHEDALLIELSEKYKKNWPLIANIINVQIYGGKPIRGPRGCQIHHEDLVQKSAIAKPQLSGDNPSLIHPHLLEKHNIKLTLMRGSTTKIITPRSIVPKKISFNVHPSHEAAARKANQNISKLLTPSELAQRRLQRTRLINDSGTLNVPSIPRSTPSPIPSNVSNSGANVTQSSGSPSVLNIPNLPQFPSVNAPMNLASNPQQQQHQQLQNNNPNTMIRPPSGPQQNHISVQLQQLQQLQQMQHAHRMQQQNFSESPSKMVSQRPPMQNGGQIRPSGNYMNLPSGLTAIQLQQLQQKQVQVNQMHQASQLQQMQQMYVKAMQQARPANSNTNPSIRPVSGINQNTNTNTTNPIPRRPTSPQPSGPQGPPLDSLNPDSQAQDSSGNLRTSPRKSINK